MHDIHVRHDKIAGEFGFIEITDYSASNGVGSCLLEIDEN